MPASHPDARELAKSIRDRVKYGLRYSDGSYETSPDMWEKRDARDIVVQTPEELDESGIGMCHDVTQALLRRLRENRIRGTAVMLKGSREPDLPTHSFVVTKRDGKYTVLDPLSYDSGYKGGYESMDDAISGRIEDWKKENDKGDVISSRIRSRDWKKRGLLDFLRYRYEKKASDAKYSLKDDPTYEDALKVFNKLDFDDRANLVPRHPDFLRKVPDDMLFDRQVVVDGKGDPVGFQEFYSRKDKRGRRLPPHNIIAVAPEARGNGLARIMAEAAVRKARKEKVKRLLWEAFADNESSIRAALSAGFEDATPKRAKGYRKLVYDVEKKAHDEKYESGSGTVESYDPDKTKGHDEIVIRTKDGRRIRISNNTRLGKRLGAKKGDRVNYNGYRVRGTDVVHKVHPNAHQRGGWLEREKSAEDKTGGKEKTKDKADKKELERRERRRRILRRAIIASIGAGAIAAPAYFAGRLRRAGDEVTRIHDETDPHLSLRQLSKELNRQGHLPKTKVHPLGLGPLSVVMPRFGGKVPVYAKKYDGGEMNAVAVVNYDPNNPRPGFNRPRVYSLTTHPKILMHELGHCVDYMNGTYIKENLEKRKSRLKEAILTVVAPSRTTNMQNEIRAWDNAKVDKSDPLRRAALGTYFAGQKMNLAKDLQGPVALSSALALGYDVKRGKKKRKKEEDDVDGEKKADKG